MSYFERAEGRLYYEVSGRADGPWMVLAHSLGQSHRLWDWQIGWMELEYRVLRYDMRGHGMSAPPVGEFEAGAMCADALALMDHLRVEQADFCGVSIGGVVGMWTAVHAPERVRRLVLSNTAAKIGTEEGWNARMELLRSGGTQALIVGSAEKWLMSQFRGEHPEVVSRFEGVLLGTSAEGYIAGCEELKAMDMRTRLGEIRCQALVVAGKYDPTTTVEQMWDLAGGIPGAEYVELEAAHLSCVDAAEDWERVVSEFLLN